MKVVAASRRRFRRFGYAKTSMQEIAEDCRMSAANLYRYYDGKLEIGAAVTAVEEAGLFAACDRAVDGAGPDVVRRLTALFHAVIDGTRRQLRTAPMLFDLQLAVQRGKPELRVRFLAEIEARISAILAADSAGGTEEPGNDGESRSRLVLFASAPFVLPWMMQNTPFGDPRPQVEPLLRCLVAGMGAERRPGTPDGS